MSKKGEIHCENNRRKTSKEEYNEKCQRKSSITHKKIKKKRKCPKRENTPRTE